MQKNLTTGSVLKNLIYFSLPYLLSSFLQTFYGMADLFIAGQFNGSASISAISTGSQIMHMLTVIIVGIAMGTTVIISQSVGAKNDSMVRQAIGNSTTLFMGISIVLTGILLLLTNPIIRILSVPTEAVSEARVYLMICFIGIPFITAYNIISCILRGMGDSKTPMYFIGIACVFNIALDYIFMGCFHMGAAGAALGTVLAQSISVACALFVLLKKNDTLSVKRSDFRPNKKVMSSILNIGIPIALQDGFIQISFIVITIIANDRGLVVSTGVGIVEKVICFLFLIPSSMLSAISALAAQNIGAGEKGRARKTLYYGLGISVTCGIIFFVLCQFFAGNILDLFSNDSEVIRMGSQYLRSYTIDCAMAAIHFCFSGFFCAHEKSIISFIHNICSILIFRIPGAYLASVYFPRTLYPMGLAAPIGSAFSAIVCACIYIHYRKKGEL